MASVDELYPSPCPFCRISKAYPASAKPIPSNPDPEKVSPQCHLILSTPHLVAFLDIMPLVPGHVLLTTREHYEKLSDLHPPPSTASRGEDWLSHRRREHQTQTAEQLGRWLPIMSRALCTVTGVEDWNVVQNNGARAAQVVPHIHFHFIPRYQEGRGEADKKGNVDPGTLKSWRMFGRGQREDLDDEEGAEIARRLREAIEMELEENESTGRENKL